MSTPAWGRVEISPGECRRTKIGGVTLWTRVIEDEWQVAHEYIGADVGLEGAQESVADADLEDLDWTRYVTIKDDDVAIQPALPDRPVLLRPQSPIVILPGRWGRFYFSVPLWIRFVSGSGSGLSTMVEIPTQNLSSTWFGDMESGELCYSMNSRLLRSLPETDADEAFARCEVEIRNGSKERLQFERICVHVKFLHLYAAGGKYWSGQVRVVFKGSEQVSQISYVPGAPKHLTGADVACEPRETLDRGILKRSFNLIREITGI